MIRILGVSKSTLYYKPKGYPERQPSSRKDLSEESKNAILEITGKKSTYGCPRVRAILKRDYQIELSKYMVNRFMKEVNTCN